MSALPRAARLFRRVVRAVATALIRPRKPPAGELDGYEAWLDESFAR